MSTFVAERKTEGLQVTALQGKMVLLTSTKQNVNIKIMEILKIFQFHGC